jgi:L-threonylcarbamoyladenylate synthase
LIVHIHDTSLLEKWASDIPEYASKLARDFWPGPMTLIVKRSELAKDFITGGQDTVGLRIPAHPVALALLTRFAALGGLGVAAPSANRFGAVSPTTANAVMDELIPYLNIDHDRILDGGPSLVGVESTIIDCTHEQPQILRPGAITAEMIAESTGCEVFIPTPDEKPEIRTSGSLESHYAPKARVILDAIPEAGEGYIAMNSHATPHGVIRLASPESIEQFARDLYSALRDADARELSTVVVMQPNGDGLAEAIRDRLKRASSK